MRKIPRPVVRFAIAVTAFLRQPCARDGIIAGLWSGEDRNTMEETTGIKNVKLGKKVIFRVSDWEA